MKKTNLFAEAYVDILKEGALPENSTDDGRNFLNGLVRDMRADLDNDIYGLPIAKTCGLGADDVFSSLLYIRGSVIRSYDNDTRPKADSVTSEAYKYDKDGKCISSETDKEAQPATPSKARIKGHFAFGSENATHDIIPYCYRNDCTFNQSFIYTVAHPASQRYNLDVTAKLDLLAYEGVNSWFYMTDKYYYYQNASKYRVVLNPPPATRPTGICR